MERIIYRFVELYYRKLLAVGWKQLVLPSHNVAHIS